jgi:hypothetical protein
MLLEKVQMQHQGFSFHRLHKALIWRLNNSKTDSTIGWSKIQRQTNHHQLQYYTVIINTKQWSSSIIKLKILKKIEKNNYTFWSWLKLTSVELLDQNWLTEEALVNWWFLFGIVGGIFIVSDGWFIQRLLHSFHMNWNKVCEILNSIQYKSK